MGETSEKESDEKEEDEEKSSEKSRGEKGKDEEESVNEKEISKETLEDIEKNTQQYTEEDKNFMEEYEDYNRELPPYQPQKSLSESYFSLSDESVIIDKMHQMSIHDDTDPGQ